MTATADASLAAPAAKPAVAAPTKVRDLRLDFYRGIAMFIILVAHIPSNFWKNYIPARYGWSDATEIFVFCSGMASAMAFGAVFAKRGFGLGLARVLFRIWQVYWAHIGLFFAIAFTVVVIEANGWGVPDKDYILNLNLRNFFDRPEEQLLGLMTLTYVPNYFDILPMYLGILAMIPVMMALAKVDPRLAIGFSVSLWLVAQFGYLNLPAEPWSDREWFFNPFAWQLVFFTGFAFMRGWLPTPPVTWWLIALALAMVLITIPFDRQRIYREIEWIMEWRFANNVLFAKTDFGILRYLHFLSLAYLAWLIAGPKGAWLLPRGAGLLSQVWGVILTWITKVGSQSLAVFVVSMWLARVLGFGLDLTPGREAGWVALANLTGFAILIGVAYLAGWFKTQPWRKPKPDPVAA